MAVIYYMQSVIYIITVVSQRHLWHCLHAAPRQLLACAAGQRALAALGACWWAHCQYSPHPPAHHKHNHTHIHTQIYTHIYTHNYTHIYTHLYTRAELYGDTLDLVGLVGTYEQGLQHLGCNSTDGSGEHASCVANKHVRRETYAGQTAAPGVQQRRRER